MNTHIITIWILQHQLNDSITAKWSFLSQTKTVKDVKKTACLCFPIHESPPTIVFYEVFAEMAVTTKEEKCFRRTIQMQMSGGGGWKWREQQYQATTK